MTDEKGIHWLHVFWDIARSSSSDTLDNYLQGLKGLLRLMKDEKGNFLKMMVEAELKYWEEQGK